MKFQNDKIFKKIPKFQSFHKISKFWYLNNNIEKW